MIHAQKADRAGNVFLEGIVGVQKQAVLAAKRALVTVEEVVDGFRAALAQCDDPAVVDRHGDCTRARRRAPVLRAGLLHARQCLLQGVGCHRA